jgi:hypothetical protein
LRFGLFNAPFQRIANVIGYFVEMEVSSPASLIVFLALFFANFVVSWIAVILVMDGSLKDAQGRQAQLDIERAHRDDSMCLWLLRGQLLWRPARRSWMNETARPVLWPPSRLANRHVPWTKPARIMRAVGRQQRPQHSAPGVRCRLPPHTGVVERMQRFPCRKEACSSERLGRTRVFGRRRRDLKKVVRPVNFAPQRDGEGLLLCAVDGEHLAAFSNSFPFKLNGQATRFISFFYYP